MKDLYKKAIENLANDTEASINTLLKGLGDPSPQIRDELVYKELCNFVQSEANNGITNKRIFLKLLSDNHLKAKGDKIEVVLMRSFSALLLSNVIFHDHSTFKGLLTEDLKEAFKVVSQYLERENNIEDQNKEYGWIHCFAHAGDVLTTLMFHEHTHHDFAKEIESFIVNLNKKDKIKRLDADSLERLSGAIGIGKALKKIS